MRDGPAFFLVFALVVIVATILYGIREDEHGDGGGKR